MSVNDVMVAVEALSPADKARLIGMIADRLVTTDVPVVQSGWQVTTDAESLRTFFKAAGMPLPNE